MSKKVLILGAGRSSTSLIDYLIKAPHDWQVAICDLSGEGIQKRFPRAEVLSFDIRELTKTRMEIEAADLVISMLPAALHVHIAEICATLGKNLLTASYLSPEINSLSGLFEQKGALCLMEMGLDPGIDHMSAMRVLHRIKGDGHELHAFETFTGGLLADDTKKDNPWNYKFTWNPRNVVLAGTGNVKFLQEGKYKYIPYNRLFTRTELIHIPGYGYFEGYANRDSLKYLNLYGLRGIRTLYRGTLRRPGFCKAWNTFVQLGATDDTYLMENVGEMTHRDFINSFLQYNPQDSVELKLAHYMGFGLESEEMYKLQWLGIFEKTPVGLLEGTPAQILEHILKKKWTLDDTDQDMVVMWHKFSYHTDNGMEEIQSHMVATGDARNTAMAKTVGLPLAIASKLILTGKIRLTGVKIPTLPEIYEPVLQELQSQGLQLEENVLPAH